MGDRVARAYAPGHVSGLFAVHDEATDVLHKGSRGAGWSVDAGATAAVRRRAPTAIPNPSTVVRINGLVASAATTLAALARLAPTQAFEVDLHLGLPVGQGFGMSAAGTLAACLAVCSLLDDEPERALEAAHAAEVGAGTGLGDAVGSWFGAGEVRMKPGCPPHGWATRVEPPHGFTMFYAVLGDPIATRSVIRTPAWKQRTRELGDAAVDRILAAGRSHAWDTILEESAQFTRQLGLLTPALQAAAAALPPGARWGQCMLGTTMWVAPPVGETLDPAAPAWDAIERSLSRHGATQMMRLGIDGSGARVVRSLA